MLSETIISALNRVLMRQDDWLVKDTVASALCEHSTLPQSSIFILIQALQDKNEKSRSLAAWVLSFYPNELYGLLPSLATEHIQSLYTKVLFPNSCKKITSLIIQSNQLQFDTAAGQKQSIELPSEQIEKIIGALKATQAEAGVALRSKSG